MATVNINKALDSMMRRHGTREPGVVGGISDDCYVVVNMRAVKIAFLGPTYNVMQRNIVLGYLEKDTL